MRKKFGIVCIAVGAVLVLGALALLGYNQIEQMQAQVAADRLLPQLFTEIEHNVQKDHAAGTMKQPLGTPLDYLEPETLVMTEVEINGYAYIGYLSIPSQNLELPVMADWDYTRLKIAPCRYTGTVRGEDLVIMAHNYDSHFGRLSKLSEGDRVIFTDMDGVTTDYAVVVRDVLSPYAVEEMTSGDFDLTLFTCTFGGKSRVTVYCDRADD